MSFLNRREVVGRNGAFTELNRLHVPGRDSDANPECCGSCIDAAAVAGSQLADLSLVGPLAQYPQEVSTISPGSEPDDGNTGTDWILASWRPAKYDLRRNGATGSILRGTLVATDGFKILLRTLLLPWADRVRSGGRFSMVDRQSVRTDATGA